MSEKTKEQLDAAYDAAYDAYEKAIYDASVARAAFEKAKAETRAYDAKRKNFN